MLSLSRSSNRTLIGFEVYSLLPNLPAILCETFTNLQELELENFILQGLYADESKTEGGIERIFSK